MKAYRKVLRARMALLSALALFAVGLGIYDSFFATAEVKASNVFAFQCGITAVLGMAAAAAMVRYSSALRDENSLRRQYVKENDERMKAIRAKAGMPLNLAFAVALMVAGTVLGYCNELIFVTLIAVAAAQLLTAAVVKLIFMRVT